jgi:hypothetical protein
LAMRLAVAHVTSDAIEDLKLELVRLRYFARKFAVCGLPSSRICASS